MFSIFKRKPAAPQPPPTSEVRPADFVARLKAFLTANRFHYRDADLAPAAIEQYRVGLLFRERTLCDATYKFGGLAGTTRFLVISAQAMNVDAMSSHPEWGLCLLPANALFKVIDIHREGGKSQITVLHVPADFEPFFRSDEAQRFESLLVPQTRQDFADALRQAPLSELMTSDWRERTAWPLGTDNEGRLVAG